MCGELLLAATRPFALVAMATRRTSIPAGDNNKSRHVAKRSTLIPSYQMLSAAVAGASQASTRTVVLGGSEFHPGTYWGFCCVHRAADEWRYD